MRAMSDEHSSKELRCPECSWTSVCGPAAMKEWLAGVHMVRRQAEPDPELVPELFQAAAGRFTCPRCGNVGLVLQSLPEESDESWGMARRCEVCRKPISRERLEIFPDARLCVGCQTGSDQGQSFEAPEYCPSCGNIMVLRQSRGPGITRFVMTCNSCRN